MRLLSLSEVQEAIQWTPDGDAFVVSSISTCEKDILPRFFKQSKFSSFVRKLNRWGFKQLSKGETSSRIVLFQHPLFKRGEIEMCMRMSCSEYGALRNKVKLMPPLKGDDSSSDGIKILGGTPSSENQPDDAAPFTAANGTLCPSSCGPGIRSLSNDIRANISMGAGVLSHETPNLTHIPSPGQINIVARGWTHAQYGPPLSMQNHQPVQTIQLSQAPCPPGVTILYPCPSQSRAYLVSGNAYNPGLPSHGGPYNVYMR